MKIVLVVCGLLIANFGFSQLDQKYFTTYMDDNASYVFTIYSVDELSEHCFLVDYEEWGDSDELVAEQSGYGHCDDSDGMKASFYFENYTEPVQAEFDIDEYGDILLHVKFPDKEDEILLYSMGDFDELNPEEIDDSEPMEFTFHKEDETSLVLYEGDGQIAFILSGAPNEACENSLLSGVLLPQDESMTVLYYASENGCKITMEATPEGITLVESNCSSTREKSCSAWSGFYQID